MWKYQIKEWTIWLLLNDFDKNNILQAILLQKRIYAHNQFQKKKMCMISEPKSMLHGEKHIVHIHVLVHERVKKNVPVPNYPHPLPRKSMVHPLLSYLTFVVIKKLCWWGNFFFWGGGGLHIPVTPCSKNKLENWISLHPAEDSPSVKTSEIKSFLLNTVTCMCYNLVWFHFITVSSPMVLICPWLVWKHEWSILSG